MSRRAHHRRPTPVVEDAIEGGGELVWIALLDEEAGDIVLDETQQSADRRGDDGDPARRGLESDEPEALATAGNDDRIGRAVERREDVVRLGRHEADPVVKAELVDEVVGPVELGIPVGTARSSDEHEHRVTMRHLSEGANGDVGTFQGLDAADEQQHRPIERQFQGSTRSRLVARGEEGVLDGGRDDLDAPVRLAIQPFELLLLRVAADADRIGACDDLLLGPIPPPRLRISAFRLHSSERVERRDEGDVEVVLESVAGNAAQPVVGVDGVDAGAGADVSEDEVVELIEHLGERFLGKVARSGRNVHDSVPWLDEHLRIVVGARTTRVGRALDPRLSKRGGDLPDVDVHPATVA